MLFSLLCDFASEPHRFTALRQIFFTAATGSLLFCLSSCEKLQENEKELRAQDEQAFKEEIMREGVGWLTRQFGNSIPNAQYAHETILNHKDTIKTKRDKLEQTLAQLSSQEARKIVCQQLSFLKEQDSKLSLLLEALEESTYTYLLMIYAHQVIPTQTDNEDLHNIIGEIDHALKTVEEIEKEINNITEL